MVFHQVIQDAAGAAGQVAGSAAQVGEQTLQEAEEQQEEQQQAGLDAATGFATGNLGQALSGTSELAEDQAQREAAAQEDSGGGNALDWAWGGLTDVGSAAQDAATDAGSSIPAQFDDEEGGGFADWTIGGLQEESGLREWQETETFQELNQQVAEGGILDRVDAGARGLVDFTLDNPRFSVQDTARGGLVEATRFATGNDEWEGEDLATAVSSTGSNIQGGIGDFLSGTPLDNPGTDALTWVGEAVAVEPGKAVLGGTTGLDVDEGDTEATVGAMDAFDIGVGAATFGGGTLAARAAGRSADEGGSLLGRIFGGGSDEATQAADEGATPALPAPDEAAQASDEGGQGLGALFGDDAGQAADDVTDANTRVFTQADEAAQTSDESAGAFRETVLTGGDDAAQGADDLPALADDAAQTGDDVAQAADNASGGFVTETLAPGFAAVGRMGEDFLNLGARGADEGAAAADDAAGAADEGGSLIDDLLGRGSDDAAQASDDAAAASDDAATAADDTTRAGTEAAEETAEQSSRFRQFLGTRTGQVATAGAGVIGAGAVYQEAFSNPRNAPDEIETEAGEVLTARKTYEPTRRFPNGGRLYEVRRDGSQAGFWTLLGREGRNLIVLDSNGETRQAQISIEQFREMVQGGQGGNQ